MSLSTVRPAVDKIVWCSRCFIWSFFRTLLTFVYCAADFGRCMGLVAFQCHWFVHYALSWKFCPSWRSIKCKNRAEKEINRVVKTMLQVNRCATGVPHLRRKILFRDDPGCPRHAFKAGLLSRWLWTQLILIVCPSSSRFQQEFAVRPLLFRVLLSRGHIVQLRFIGGLDCISRVFVDVDNSEGWVLTYLSEFLSSRFELYDRTRKLAPYAHLLGGSDVKLKLAQPSLHLHIARISENRYPVK